VARLSDPTVFVVDDDSDVRESLCFLFASAGLRTKAYSSAQQFIDAYNAATPGCLVLDMRLPGMSGIELQEHLASQGATIPTIVITAYGDIPMAVRSLRAGAIEFLQKPFSDEVLLSRCRQAIRIDRETRARERLGLLSSRARLVLGCLQMLDKVSVERVARAISLSTVEVSKCIAELQAVYCPVRQ
jgi:two-component system response regulator FixJ